MKKIDRMLGIGIALLLAVNMAFSWPHGVNAQEIVEALEDENETEKTSDGVEGNEYDVSMEDLDAASYRVQGDAVVPDINPEKELVEALKKQGFYFPDGIKSYSEYIRDNPELLQAAKEYFSFSEELEAAGVNRDHSGKCGENARWELSDDGVLTISGTGKLYNSSYVSSLYGSKWNSCDSEIKSIVVEDGITEIGKYCFMLLTEMETVTIADSVTKIGDYAFSDCYSLTEIEFPDSVTEIGVGVFAQCDSLRKFKMPAKVNRIPNVMFVLSGIRCVEIPSTITSVGNRAFGSCDLVEAVFDGSEGEWSRMEIGYGNEPLRNAVIRYPGAGIFANPPLSGSCGNSVTWRVDDSQLTISGSGDMEDYSEPNGSGHPWYRSRSQIRRVMIEDGITRIGDNAFNDLYNLDFIKIGDKVESIGDNAFAWTNIRTAVLSDNVKALGKGAFQECCFLETVSLPKDLVDLPERLFYSCRKLSAIDIPSEVKAIGINCFEGCKAMTELVIPEKVEYVDANILNGTDISAIRFLGPLPEIGGDNVFGYAGNITYCEKIYYYQYRDYFQKRKLMPTLCTGGTAAELNSRKITLSAEMPEFKLQASVDGKDDGLSITWIPLNPDIADVDGFGNVRSLAHGETFVYAEVGYSGNMTFVGCRVHSKRNDLFVGVLPKDGIKNDFPVDCTVYANDKYGKFLGYNPGKLSETDTSNKYYIEIKQAVDGIIKDCGSETEKAEAIQKWITANLKYEGLIGIGSTVEQVYSTYLSRSGHCEAYSKLTGFMLYLAGIPSCLITNAAHMWNIAYVDSKWIMIDSTNGKFDFSYDEEWYGMINRISFGDGGDLCMVIDDTSGIKLAGVGDAITEEDRANIESVAVPEYTKSILGRSFLLCSGLKNLSLPTSVADISDGVFSTCESLSDVYYRGSKEEWEAIHIGENNAPLLSARIHLSDGSLYSALDPSSESEEKHTSDDKMGGEDKMSETPSFQNGDAFSGNQPYANEDTSAPEYEPPGDKKTPASNDELPRDEDTSAPEDERPGDEKTPASDDEDTSASGNQASANEETAAPKERPWMNDDSNNHDSGNSTAAHMLNVTAFGGGAIEPSGILTVSSGSIQEFRMVPGSGNEVDYIEVDGERYPASQTFTLRDIRSDHEVTVYFRMENASEHSFSLEGFNFVVTHTKSVSFNGTRHFEYGRGTDNDKKSFDVRIKVMIEGAEISPSEYKTSFKKNKKKGIGRFIIKLKRKGKIFKAVNKQLKKRVFKFSIA